MCKNFLLVGGKFDHESGKASKIFQTIYESLNQVITSNITIEFINGGNISLLDNCINNINQFSVVLWMPDISNDEEKYLPDIKKNNPKCLLISSKRIDNREISIFNVVCKLLKTHSNLGILINKHHDKYVFKLIDPLGNEFNTYTFNIESFVKHILWERIRFLLKLNRVNSVCVGNGEPVKINTEYLNIVKSFGEKFSALIQAINPERFLGNTSTRCMHGFPSVRVNNKDTILVSQRNIDKCNITEDSFVEVSLKEDNTFFEYFGNNKPSVDTPVNIKLYNYYQNINYIIHGHVYVKDALFTSKVIPCGYIEEFDEIKKMFNPDVDSIIINLLGHGCLIGVKTLEMFNSIELIPRSFLELVDLKDPIGMINSNLKKCPFCGGEPFLNKNGASVSVVCSKCLVKVTSFDFKSAMSKWNHREN